MPKLPFLITWTKLLMETTIRNLEADFTQIELKSAFKSMTNKKSPGMDGFPCEFYKKFQEKQLPLLLEAANHSINIGQMSTTQKSAIVTLLHKHGERSNLANWRPISLLCKDYQNYHKSACEKYATSIRRNNSPKPNLWHT